MQNDNQFKPGQQTGQRPPYPPQRPSTEDIQNSPNNNQAPGMRTPQRPGYPASYPRTNSPNQIHNHPSAPRQTLPIPSQDFPAQKPQHPNHPPSTNLQHQPIGKPINSAPNNQNSPVKKKKREELKNTLYTVALFVLAPLFAVFMIIFVFQSYVVDGSSMEPTLDNNDRVFILKLPKSIASLRGNEYTPSRNEVIVFKKPGVGETQLIKRVIGLPGDKVVIENGEITIYNIDNPGGFDPDEGTDYIADLATYSLDDPLVEANVGEGELFVLGDNRTPGGSLDSHSGLGLVPTENVVGKLWIRYFPLSSFEMFSVLPSLLVKL